MKRNSLAGQILSFAVSLLIVAAGIFGFRALIYKPEAEASAKTPPPKPLVHTATILAHSGSLDFRVDGVVIPFREIDVAAEVAGKVVFKGDACDSGRFVTQGTPLITIDGRDYENAVQRLENQFKQAAASIKELQVEIDNMAALIKIAEEQVALEQREVQRLTTLFKDRVVTDSDLDRANQSELGARNSLVQLQNQRHLLETRQGRLENARELVGTDLEMAQLDLARTKVVAAVDGVVMEDLVEQDSFVQKGQLIFKLEDTSEVEVKCRLKMEDLYWVWCQEGEGLGGIGAEGSGQQFRQVPVTVTYRLADRQGMHYEWQGVLLRFTPFDGVGLDEATRTVQCRVRVAQPRDVKIVSDRKGASEVTSTGSPATLMRGMFVTVTFHVDPPSPLLLIPERAVQPGKAIWIVRDGRLEEKASLDLIELIQVNDDEGREQAYWLVEAAATGLQADDRVVVPPFGVLHDGEQVEEPAR